MTTRSRVAFVVVGAILSVIMGACTSESKISKAYQQGRRASEAGDYDLAISCFSETIRLNPRNAVSYSNRGGAYLLKEDYDSAIADCTEAIRLDPKYRPAYCNRGRAYVGKHDAADMLPSGEHPDGVAETYCDKAIADFSEAIRLDPEDGDAYNGRGRAYWSKLYYDKAIADLTQAIRCNPQDGNSYLSRGFVYSMKGETSKSDADLAEVKRLGYSPGPSVRSPRH